MPTIKQGIAYETPDLADLRCSRPVVDDNRLLSTGKPDILYREFLGCASGEAQPQHPNPPLMHVVLLTLFIGFLFFLGWIAKICIFRIWGNFQMLRFLSENAYGILPMAKRHFLLIVFCWVVVIFCFAFPPGFALGLIIIAISMKRVIARSSPEVAYRLAFYAFLMALVIVFTLIGFVALVLAMASKRQAIMQEKIDAFRQLENHYAVTAANRIY